MSKLLILSAGVSEDSNNTKLAKKLNKFLDEKAVPNEIHENLYENIPFLLNNQKDVPKKILEMRKSLESADKIIIFSPVYNGGFLAHLKNTLDWLSLACRCGENGDSEGQRCLNPFAIAQSIKRRLFIKKFVQLFC